MSEIKVNGCNCVHNACVYGLDESIKRAKYPMSADISNINNELTKGINSLAQSPAGEGHDQWLTGVVVQFDLSFTNKAWVEAERYHFLDFVSSQSTMHRITSFDLNQSFNKYVDPRTVDILQEKILAYNKTKNAPIVDELGVTIDREDDLREAYLEILYNIPAGLIITAGMTTNYRQLKTIYHQRKAHRLPEWRLFCKWIETLPMSFLITGKRKGCPNGK